jgi:hypothetical protein
VEGVAVWVEAVRLRPARVWGIGRLTWSLALVFLMLASVEHAVWLVARYRQGGSQDGDLGTILRFWWEWSQTEGIRIVASQLPLFLGALLVTGLAARWPRDPAPDAREWSGRAFLGVIMVLYVTHQAVYWYLE